MVLSSPSFSLYGGDIGQYFIVVDPFRPVQIDTSHCLPSVATERPHWVGYPDRSTSISSQSSRPPSWRCACIIFSMMGMNTSHFLGQGVLLTGKLGFEMEKDNSAKAGKHTFYSCVQVSRVCGGVFWFHVVELTFGCGLKLGQAR